MKLSHFLIPFLFAIFALLVLVGCDNGGGNGGGNYTLTLGDSLVDYPNGQYFKAVYVGSNCDSSVSSTTFESLENGNTISISGLEAGTEYTVFVWIDHDGDSNFGDTPSGYTGPLGYCSSVEIATDFSLTTDGMFQSYDHKTLDISISVAALGTDETVHCIWLLGGTLGTSVQIDDLWTDAGRAQTMELIGMVNATLLGTDTIVLKDSLLDTDFPVPTDDFHDITIPNVTYDLYCFIDIDGDGIRDSGELEYSGTSINPDTNSVSVTLDPIL
jgi:hypothetical protein